jgi:hypothetical protein
MRRVIFNLALLLVVVLLASLGAPGATASTQPATSPAVSQVSAEHSIVGRSAAPSTLQTDRLFDPWLWSGANTGAATAPKPRGAAQRWSYESQS